MASSYCSSVSRARRFRGEGKDKLRTYLIRIVFGSVNARKAFSRNESDGDFAQRKGAINIILTYSPNSRPIPDAFFPPKGAWTLI